MTSLFFSSQPPPGHGRAQGAAAPPQQQHPGNKAGTGQSAAPMLGKGKAEVWSCEADPKLPSMGRKQAGCTHPPQKALGRECWWRMGYTYAAVVGCNPNISAPSTPFLSTRGQNLTISIQMTPSHQILFADTSAAEARTPLEQKHETTSSVPFHLFINHDLAKVSLCI